MADSKESDMFDPVLYQNNFRVRNVRNVRNGSDGFLLNMQLALEPSLGRRGCGSQPPQAP